MTGTQSGLPLLRREDAAAKEPPAPPPCVHKWNPIEARTQYAVTIYAVCEKCAACKKVGWTCDG